METTRRDFKNKLAKFSLVDDVMKKKQVYLIVFALSMFFMLIMLGNLYLFLKYLFLRDLIPEKPKYYLAINKHLMDPPRYKSMYNEITVVTHLSEERIEVLEMLSKRWKGPISATFYSKTLRHPNETIDLFQTKSPYVLKRVSLHLAYQPQGEYPMNHLRNIAWENVNTSLVLSVDVDFMPSRTMVHAFEILKKTDLFDNVFRNKAMLVLPAFHLQCSDYFNIKTCYKGDPMLPDHPSQRATDISRWKTAKEPYRIDYQFLYEPYILGSVNMPRYDPQFTLGNDKTSWTYELFAAGYEFYVLPNAYVGHLPHSSKITWSLDQQEYDAFEAWVKFSRFLERIKVQYNGFDKVCSDKLPYKDIPVCLCWRWGCQGKRDNKKSKHFIRS